MSYSPVLMTGARRYGRWQFIRIWLGRKPFHRCPGGRHNWFKDATGWVCTECPSTEGPYRTMRVGLP